jgi:hypothetical protein
VKESLYNGLFQATTQAFVVGADRRKGLELLRTATKGLFIDSQARLLDTGATACIGALIFVAALEWS